MVGINLVVGLSQYTSICDNDGTGECLTNTSDPITYDDNGNLITYDGWTYNYDAVHAVDVSMAQPAQRQNRLIEAVHATKTMTYEYDPKGRRFASIKSDGTTTRKEYL